jgi:hypothetical protein
MHHEPFLYDLVRARQRDLHSAADQHRLARSVRPDRPAFLDRLRAAGTLAWLARGARRTAPAISRGPFSTAPAARPSGTACRRPDATHPAECCC